MDIHHKIRSQYRAMLTQDVELAVATTAADWVNDEAGAEPPACATPGPAGLLATGAWLAQAFDELDFEEHASLAREDLVISHITLRGRHVGPMVIFEHGRVAQVLPPSGRRIAVKQVHLHRIRDGEIVGHSAVRDDLGMSVQLGALPPSPAALVRMLAWKVSGRAARAGRDAIALTEAAARSLERLATRV